ncbi:MAG: hypothetical protein E7256_02250 [Lachnospiraceae bacterium]|nr:hypothetical protein [Lachnospiraceae bacterium]
MDTLQKAVWNDLVKCSKCGGPYISTSLGMCVCQKCGFEEPNDFGKVRDYIERNGTVPAMEISRGTGVPIRKITQYLRAGKLEIPEESDVFIHCQKCGVELRYGRYCPKCASELKQELEQAFDMAEVGAVPKNPQGKMQFLDRNRS